MNVRGYIEFQSRRVPAFRGTVHVLVEDVGRLDAPARPLAETTFTHVRREGDVRSIPFAIDVPEDVESTARAVRVHIDVNGSGDVTVGDFVSASTYPIEQMETHAEIRVRVREVV
jgi:hypothetical protein